MLSTLLVRVPTWIRVTAPPRWICNLIAVIALGEGVVLQCQPNRRTSEPQFRPMRDFGRDLHFHSHPMTLWAILFCLWGAAMLVAVHSLRPVLTGACMLAAATTLTVYTACAWNGALSSHVASLGGPWQFTGLVVWWTLSAAGLLAVRPNRAWPSS